jgi:hypothetical protein
VSGKRIDPSKVTAADIVGGINAQGEETGLEVIRQIYPKLGIVPGILIAPTFSKDATVAAALQAKTKSLNGIFRVFSMVDMDTSATGARYYTDVKGQKTKQALTSEDCLPIWLCGKVGEVIYSGSALAAAYTALNDANNGNVPNVSPSNISVSISAACLEDGTEIYLDQEQANLVNSFGVSTFLNMNGFHLWGNNTAAYPSTTDPKDRYISARRFLSWDWNTFVLTYHQRVDSVANKRLIEAIVDSENQRGNAFVARGICARYELQYIESENPVTDLMNGTITFHKYVAPFLPAEVIKEVVEFDPSAIQTALAE